MIRSNKLRRNIVLATALGMALPFGCDSSGNGTSGETHFLACNETSECGTLGAGYSCIAHLCLQAGDASVGCTPGRQVTCACPGGSSGVQVCLADGAAYGPCTGCTDASSAGTGGAATGGGVGSGGVSNAGGNAGGAGGGVGRDAGSGGVAAGGKGGGGGGNPNGGAAGGANDGGAGATGGASGTGGGTSDSSATGIMIELASGQKTPHGILVDTESAYWVNAGDGAVMKVAITGGTPIQLGSGGLRRIALDDTSVYWTTGSAVMKVPKAGGAPITLASGQNGANELAVDGTSVYWFNGAGSCTCNGFGICDCTPTQVMKIAKSPGDSGVDAGGPTTLATLPLPPYAIAVDGASVYCTNNSVVSATSAVTKVAIDGGTAVPIAPLSGSNWGTSIVVDSANVYWTNVAASSTLPTTYTSSVMRAPIGGGTPTTVSYDPATNVVHDGTHLYWIGSGYVIKRSTLDGRLTYQIVVAPNATRLAVDVSSLYWTSSSAGTVTRFTAK